MKKISIILFILVHMLAKAQQPREFALEVSAFVNKTNKTIKLSWLKDSMNNGSVNIYRKKKDDKSWGSVYKKIVVGKYDFTDTVNIGEGYEYYLKKTIGSFTGGGYVYSGIELPIVENRGRVLLVIENTVNVGIPLSINQYEIDLRADGWQVSRVVVDKLDDVDTVKQKIKDIYALYKNDLKTICLIGHVPVPYSGLMNPDGHPDHKGAWPADAFYGDVEDDIDNWTDIVVKDTTSAIRAANKNWSNDGKFDNTYLPSDIELQIGRIDLYDMPEFGKTELELLEAYFKKDHDFKIKKIKPIMKGLIDDNFKGMPEAFSANAWRNFSVLLDTNNYTEEDYFTTLDSMPYIWSYGCGGGWYQGAGGVGTTSDFNLKKTKGIFTMLFGSYFGDWDVTNSFLRAPLASPQSTILTNAWVGRPWWQFHHMGLGEHIGYAAMLSQNNQNLYTNAYNFAAGMVHIALMGDPTLRMHIIDPVDSVYTSLSHGGAFVNLNWDRSEDLIEGYNIYRSDKIDGIYKKINKQMITDSIYIDARPFKGENYYMVKAARLELTPSGTYFNQSLGCASSKVNIDSIDYQGIANISGLTMSCYPNPSNGQLRIVIQPQSANSIINITDILGKTVYTDNIAAHLTFKEINLTHLPDGMYILNLSSANKQGTMKFLINR